MSSDQNFQFVSKMNPLLKEIQHDQLMKQMIEDHFSKRTNRDQIEQMHCVVCKGQPDNYNSYQWGSPPGQVRSQTPQNQCPSMQAGNITVIPQTFLPTQVTAPIPPPSFEAAASKSGPFNPFCQPLYPPGCPTPGCPGSYPGYQPPSNVPPTMCYQQEFRVNCPSFSGNNIPPPRFQPSRQ